uniref:Caspase recruitment domain family, member 14 n=1 Tax=Electrophorus electricus TaxID=8005 RepID=A0A4W4EIY0_ELEEL
ACGACHRDDMGEEELWDLINDNRHAISLGVRADILIPYLRQARVLTDLDEDEILTCLKFTNRCMRTSESAGHMLDLLRIQGRNGAVALLDSLMIHYPCLYTQVTGRKPSTEPSGFSGLIKYSELTEYLVRAVTSMQKELQEAREEAVLQRSRCCSLEGTLSQALQQGQEQTQLQAEHTRLRNHFAGARARLSLTQSWISRGAVSYRIGSHAMLGLVMRYLGGNTRDHCVLCACAHVTGVRVCWQAYLARDEAQAQIACSLAEKDTLRGQLVELQEKVFTLKALNTHTPPNSSTVSGLHPTRPLHPIFPMHSIFIEDGFSSVRSSMVEPPCSESLRRREIDPQFDDHSIYQIFFSTLPCPAFSFCLLVSPRLIASLSVLRTSAPPFLVRTRPQALRIMGRALTFSFQAEALLSQLQVIGGNKTGVFVHQVTEGSAASVAGISPGAQILELDQRALRMVLEDSTMEEALWALAQVRGPCSLSVRPKQDGKRNLLQQLKRGDVQSGDSFYVRVNVSLPGGVAGALSVTCNDILHVTNTHHGNDGSWWASQVHSCQLMDLKSGTLPNYYSLCFKYFYCSVCVSRSQGKQKAVRIVSTGHTQLPSPIRLLPSPILYILQLIPYCPSPIEHYTQAIICCPNPFGLFLPTDNGHAPRSCVILMPYTLVTPHYPPVCRPVLLLPTILGRVLPDSSVLLCVSPWCCSLSETLSVTEHVVQMQKGEVLEECDSSRHCCYTVHGVEKIMKRGTHCVLPLGLDSVRRLHRAEIFPIIIFVASTERSAPKLGKVLQICLTEAQLLECSRSEEPLLDKLPCLYRTIPPDTWSDSATLVDTIKHVVQEEQRKIVWVEPDLW